MKSCLKFYNPAFIVFILSGFALLVSCHKSKSDTNYEPFILKSEFYLYENPDKGMFVGIASAFDRNSKDSLKFNIISGNDGQAFVIDSLTGLIRVNNPQVVDFETHPVFNLLVVVRDNAKKPLTDTSSITINVLDVGITRTGLVSYIPFKNTLRDSIGAVKLVGKNIGFFTDRFLNPNEVCQFVGFMSYVTIDSSYDFPKRTISFWYSVSDVFEGQPQVIYSTDNASLQNGKTLFSIMAESGSYKIIMQVGNVSDTTTFDLGQWNQAAVIVDGNVVKFVQNGQILGAKTITTFAKSADGTTFTTLGVDRTLKAKYFQGSIDDLFIYNRALSDSEIRTVFLESNLAQ
jgi:hypothetical protein